MPVAQIGRYLVSAELGRGGMGVVYRAEDPTLGRPVALKLLTPEASRTPGGRAQLLTEARAAAALDHPNICTIYEVGDSNGDLFIAMALYEGQTLDERLEGGRLPPDEALDIAAQVARGLLTAHASGIVHLDVKPSNIMLTRGGLVKILDFGVAHLAGDVDVTGGLILGTPTYMAPERLEGAADLDGRTDAWSLGVVLFTMLTGTPPFLGATTSVLLRAILLDDLPFPTNSPEFSGLGPLVAGLLTKQRDGRMTLEEFVSRLSQPSTPVAVSPDTPRPTSLAVLPFQHFSAEPDSENFTDGLTVEIIADLAQVPGLRVTSWTSVRRFRSVGVGIRDLARELDVRYVLEGSVRRAGGYLRITARLLDASTEEERWSGRFSGSLDEIFAIQDRMSQALAQSLQATLTPGGARVWSIRNPEAYELFLRARGEAWSFAAEGPRRALGLITRALALAGRDASLLALRATAIWQLVNTGGAGPELLADAADAAREALALAPDSAPALRVLALIHAMRGDSVQALALMRRALDAGPNEPETLSSACLMNTLVGDTRQAVALGERATELDPLYALHWTALGFAYSTAGRDADAAAAVRRACQIGPGDPATQVAGPLVMHGRGDLAALWQRFDASPLPATGGVSYATLAEVTRAALTGQHDRAQALLTPALKGFLASGVHNALFGAEIFAIMGDASSALQFLDRAADLGLSCADLLTRHSHTLAPLRTQPAFSAIVAKVTASRDRQS